eukprot:g40192.t1
MSKKLFLNLLFLFSQITNCQFSKGCAREREKDKLQVTLERRDGDTTDWEEKDADILTKHLLIHQAQREHLGFKGGAMYEHAWYGHLIYHGLMEQGIGEGGKLQAHVDGSRSDLERKHMQCALMTTTLTSIIMKCFERLVMGHTNCSLPACLDPLQFAYQHNRSTQDAISLALYSSLEHLDNKDTYIRLLLIDYS